jgi:hypothetical protein
MNMRAFFLCLALAIGATSASAQNVVPPLPELTNLEEFSSRSGTLIQREFTRVGEFASPFRVDVVKVTDLMAKNSLFGVRISGNVGTGAVRDIAFLDADEIDHLIRAIDLLKSSAFSTTPDNFTDLVYRTRGGIAIGALYANKKWNAYLRLDRYDPQTSISIDQNDIETLRSLLLKARESIR